MREDAMSSPSLDYQNQPDNKHIKHIPGREGLPYLGRMIDIVRDYMGVINDHKTNFGNISRVKAIPQRAVMVLGADNWQKVLLDKDKNFSAQMGYMETLGAFYEGGLLLLDFDEHKLSRRLMQTAFKNDSMRGYTERMVPIMRNNISSWESGFEFFPAIKETLLQVAAEVFVGLPATQAADFKQDFHNISDGLLGVVRAEWPITAYGRGQRSKRALFETFSKLIEGRRGVEGMTDMLSYMSNETTEEGELFPTDDISKHMNFLLFAAHDTTASALSHMIYYTAKHPEWQQKMREECLALNKDTIEYDDLKSFPTIDLVFDEAQRLHPSVPILTRRTIRPCEFEGVQVPENVVLFMPTAYNHRDPEHWTNPHEFDPMRFTPGREEHKNHSFCYHPFGGGAHKCIGMHFARMIVKTFMFDFLRSKEYYLPDNFEAKFQWVPLPRPSKLPVHFKDIK